MSVLHRLNVIGISWESVQIHDALTLRLLPRDWAVNQFSVTSVANLYASALCAVGEVQTSFIIVGGRDPVAWSIANALKHLQVVGSVEHIVVVSYHNCFDWMMYIHEGSGAKEVSGIFVPMGDPNVVGLILAALGIEETA